MSDLLILVNAQDREIGQAEKLEAHRLGLLHRAFSVFVCRDNEILLQKRHAAKYHSGGLWSNTCCGHPKPGETTKSAAERRLFEEIGLKLVLQEIGVFHYRAKLNDLTENEIDHVFVGRYAGENFKPDPHEIAETAWVDAHQALHDCQQNPEHYTVWFAPALQVLLKENLNR